MHRCIFTHTGQCGSSIHPMYHKREVDFRFMDDWLDHWSVATYRGIHQILVDVPTMIPAPIDINELASLAAHFKALKLSSNSRLIVDTMDELRYLRNIASNHKIAAWELTRNDGTKRLFHHEQEAVFHRDLHGGGQIVPLYY